MAIIFEGTFADLQAQLDSFALNPEERLRLESQEPISATAMMAGKPFESKMYSKVEDIIVEQDEDEVRDACRIAGYQYPDRTA